MIRDEIFNLIKKSIKILQKEEIFSKFGIPEIKIKYPKEKIHGDYSTNIALQIGKILKKKSMEIAKTLGSRLQVLGSRFFGKVEVAKPGFINFFLSKEYLQKELLEILQSGEKFGQLKIGKNKKVQVEFISANPTGPLTVGNARGGAFGDVLANVLQKAGFKAEKAYYINDYGMQILTLGHSVLKDGEAKYKGKYIDYLNEKIKEKDPYKAGEKAAKIIIDEMIKKTADKMGIKYDEWISETGLHQSSAVEEGLELLKKKGLIYEKEGALWFKSSKFGDERDRVVVKKDGWKTYLAGDITLHRYKFEKKKFDKVINIWGADHAGDVAGLQAGVEAIGHKGKLDIILLQFVTLFEKRKKLRMSKRMGTFVTMDELLDKVGSDATRFFFLQRSANTHLNFNLFLAKEQSEKNPVYYIQYAHARICSILRKVSSIKYQVSSIKLLKHPSELELIKQLIRFPEIIEDTAKDYQVQRIPQHAIDLATSFHQFYRDCRVLTEDKELTRARLGLILATKIVIKNTLSLMGISAPEKM
ncbi:arginine--tRNA ligase [Patescibacteria group bacterium]|nr:arginine--tRNA ligase [Patescibacteria group bacterium]